ncbi:hypothetical protein K402DRAFT_396096 [Aulographum hederae CBS 113979]|uniref:Uncharacterized protein n=1 Tax=Aulographum hederae CBS 113979 TaxID=1176131 RepID=A0A6G1GT83_9PEZI|nr:hypothetical protein K402DRAFT_396096 [Aulographum hederae CBS 113979]
MAPENTLKRKRSRKLRTNAPESSASEESSSQSSEAESESESDDASVSDKRMNGTKEHANGATTKRKREVEDVEDGKEDMEGVVSSGEDEEGGSLRDAQLDLLKVLLQLLNTLAQEATKREIDRREQRRMVEQTRVLEER